jgi:ubiquinone/menaquinone biosynthesis C-methylase UbiE
VYVELLPHLRCPSCHNTLALQHPEYDNADEIVVARLDCGACGTGYAVRGGIADFLDVPRPPSLAQVVNELPATAWGYERLWRPFALTLFSGEPFTYRRELPMIARLAEPQRGGLYLDLACGNGLYARALTRAMRGMAGHAVGVDHSFPMLVQARRFAYAAGLRVSFIRSKVQALPIAAGVAAGAVIGGSLNEIGDLDGCLAELRRTLANDGRYVAMTLTKAITRAGRTVQSLLGSGGIRFWTPDELIQHFDRYGFRTIGWWRYGIVLFTQCVKREACCMRHTI